MSIPTFCEHAHSTDASDTTSQPAISVLDSPAATARNTSRSRGVSRPRAAWTRPGSAADGSGRWVA
jgi:hypothetical protein